MEIWLKGKKKIRIPVLPPEYNVKSAQQNIIVNVVGLGEIMLKGKRGLMEVSFSSLFPKVYDSSYCDSNEMTPKEYVDAIEKLKRSGTVKLIITGTSINFRCTIESFEWGENDGTGDISYTITLKEYRSVSASRSSVTTIDNTEMKPAAGAEETRTEKEPEAKPYTVKQGDTLSGIARTQMGTSSWTALYEQNKALIGSNPNMLSVGMVLTIPG